MFRRRRKLVLFCITLGEEPKRINTPLTPIHASPPIEKKPDNIHERANRRKEERTELYITLHKQITGGVIHRLVSSLYMMEVGHKMMTETGCVAQKKHLMKETNTTDVMEKNRRGNKLQTLLSGERILKRASCVVLHTHHLPKTKQLSLKYSNSEKQK